MAGWAEGLAKMRGGSFLLIGLIIVSQPCEFDTLERAMRLS